MARWTCRLVDVDNAVLDMSRHGSVLLAWSRNADPYLPLSLSQTVDLQPLEYSAKTHLFAGCFLLDPIKERPKKD